MDTTSAIAEAYGNEAFVKEAMAENSAWKPMKGGLPLAAALGGMLLLHGLSKSTKGQQATARGGLQQLRQVEAQRGFGDRQNLMGGGQLSFPAASLYQSELADSNTPLGDLDKQAAEIGAATARALAKHAGIGGAALAALGALNKAPNALLKGVQAVAKPIASALPSVGLGTKVLAAGALAGGGLLAAKAGKKALNFGMEPAEERRQGAPGPGLPRYVNEYGQPTM